jgi:hypothetical protein
VTISIEVPTAEGNDDGTSTQAVEEDGCGVGEHCGVEVKLMGVKVVPEDGRSGWSVRRRSTVEEGDGLLRWRSSSRRSASGRGLGHRSVMMRAHEGSLRGLMRRLADGVWLGGAEVQSERSRVDAEA